MKTPFRRYPDIESLESRRLLTAQLVGDLNQADVSLRPDMLGRVGNIVVFRGTESSTGAELWRSDGTDEGTYLLKDTLPGQASGLQRSSFVAVNDKLFFRAVSGESCCGLWVTDGTEDGTMDVTPFPAGRDFPFVYMIDATDDVAFFVVQDATTSQVWRSDGTTKGTQLLLRFDAKQHVELLGSYRGQMLFTSYSQEDSEDPITQVWASDGSKQGTQFLVAMDSVSHVRHFVTTDEALYFTSSSTKLLWRTNGTKGGTEPIAALNSYARSAARLDHSMLLFTDGKELRLVNERTHDVATVAEVGGAEHIEDLIAADSLVYAVVRGNWPDGDQPGSYRLLTVDSRTHAVDEIPQESSVGHLDFWQVFRNELYFVVGLDRDMRLWKADGVRTELVHTFADTFEVSGGSVTTTGGIIVVATEDQLLLTSHSETNWGQMWALDETSQELVLLANVQARLDYPMPVALDGNLYFAASDKNLHTELWRTDGTREGTRVVKDYHSGTADSDVWDFVSLNGDVYFSAFDEVSKVFRMSGDDMVATSVFASQVPWHSVGPFAQTSDALYFAGSQEGVGHELMRLVGSHVEVAVDIATGPSDSFPYHVVEINGTLLFQTFGDGLDPSLIWTLLPGTGLLRRLALDGEPIQGWSFDAVPYQGRLFFSDGAGNLLSTDGVDVVLATSFAESDFFPHSFVASNEWLYFQRFKSPENQLWRTDGTPAGTSLVTTLPDRIRAIAFRDRLYFTTSDVDRNQLWVSDGTPSGTELIREFASKPYVGLGPIAIFNDRLFFSAFDSEHGTELWSSDGTTAGTVRVADIAAGDASSYPHNLTEHGGSLYFAATVQEYGTELWRTDGTQDGTVMVQDIRPGEAGATPYALKSLNGKLYFGADDGLHGREPWVFEDDVAGDANSDGAVTDADYAILAQNFGRRDAGFSDGDFDRDREVSFADFLALSANYGH